MYHSYAYNNPKKKRSLFSRLKLWLLPILLAAAGYYIYNNYPRILFLIKKDRYAPLEMAMNELNTQLAENTQKDLSKISEVSKTLTLLKKLTQDHPSDPHLYFLKGRLYSLLLDAQSRQNPNLKIEIIFNHYTGHMNFPFELSKKLWQAGVASYRKSLALGLPAPNDALARKNLLELYFLGGEPYWKSAADDLDLTQPDTSPTRQLFSIVTRRQKPNWNLLKADYGDESAAFLEAIYHLHRENTPVAFSKLKELALSSSPYLRNNAMYLMGSVMKKTRNHRMQLYYYRQIDLDEFIPRNTWFLTEFYNSLRFARERKEAQKLLADYEKIVTQLENQRS